MIDQEIAFVLGAHQGVLVEALYLDGKHTYTSYGERITGALLSSLLGIDPEIVKVFPSDNWDGTFPQLLPSHRWGRKE